MVSDEIPWQYASHHFHLGNNLSKKKERKEKRKKTQNNNNNTHTMFRGNH